MICLCAIIQNIISAFLSEKESEVDKSVFPTFKRL